MSSCSWMAIHSSEINGVTWVIFVFCVGLEVVCLKQNFCCPFKKKKKKFEEGPGPLSKKISHVFETSE